MTELDVSKVTRLEIIDENGRSYTKYQIAKIEFSLQDDARTLKVFLEVKTPESTELTDEEIAQAVGSPIDEVYLSDFRKVIAKLKEKNAYGWQSVTNPTEYLDELRGGADE